MTQIRNGTSVVELQQALGHENVATTSTYLLAAADGIQHTADATSINGLLQSP